MPAEAQWMIQLARIGPDKQVPPSCGPDKGVPPKRLELTHAEVRRLRRKQNADTEWLVLCVRQLVGNLRREITFSRGIVEHNLIGGTIPNGSQFDQPRPVETE